MPGSHVPCAGKNIKIEGPGIVYAAIGIGIAKDRQKDACLLMEDIGSIPLKYNKKEIEAYKKLIKINLAKSILQIGRNQRVKYSECFVGVIAIEAAKNEIVCALVAAPYFTLARKALKYYHINK